MRPPAAHRSPVPDLLYEDEQEARVAEIAALLDRPEAVDAGTPLHRITVFLTYRCNLACPYCKTIARSPEELAARPQKGVDHDLDSFARLLAAHAGTPLRHLHFTGGEAVLVPQLAEMVRLARASGVERVSLTSNGAASPQRYLALVDSGIDEIRVSLDAADAVLGRALTLRPHAWEASVRTIRALAERQGDGFHLILNTVVGRRNRQVLPALVRFLLSLGPRDIKLITEVDEKDDLGEFPGAAAVRADLRALVDALPDGTYPLLRRKLHTVFAADAIGLEGVAAPPGGFRCYIPLTERTVDGVHYYPCSVYLREGGEPLGRIDEPQALQRARSAAFVARADCLTDPICRRYCLHCTRAYNVRANAVRALRDSAGGR